MPAKPEALLAVTIAALCLGGCRTRKAAPSEGEETPTPVSASDKDDGQVRIVYPSAPGTFVDLIGDIRPSLVHIKSSAPVKGGPADTIPGAGPSNALGSGFVLDTAGHVVTSDHVIANAAEIRVVLDDGTELPARVIGRDAKLDVALLEADGSPRLFKPARLGNSSLLEPGEWVLAVGSPQPTEVYASAGIVSSRTASDAASIAGQRTSYGRFLRVDAVIDAANSGGPLLNSAGEVVGVNTAVDRAGRGGFVVPIGDAKQILPMLEKEGVVTRAWLGVFVHPVTRDTAKRAGLEAPTGALVSDVIEAGPGARAGLRPGDIILRFDGRGVDHRNLPWIASTATIGEAVAIEIWRDGATRSLTLVSEKMPE